MAKLKVIYIGQRLNDKGQLSHLFVKGKSDLLFGGSVGHHWIGTTYLLEKSKNGKFTFPRGGLKEAPTQPEPPTKKELNHWANQSEFAKCEAQYLRERKKIKNEPAFYKALEPIGEIYFKSLKNRKAAIEVAILKYLRAYFPKGQ